MERKSAWSLPMSEQEIVKEYKEAASPRAQIAILADQNSCDKKTIVNILVAAGCEVPAYYKKKAAEIPDQVNIEVKTQTEPEKKEPLPITVQIQLAALRAINNMVPEDFGDERGRAIFAERVAGILEFVKEVEHGNY